MSTPTTYPFPIIGLTGLAGSGKDTARAILEEFGFQGMAFADPIKNMLRDLLTSNGISEQYIDERAMKELPIPQLSRPGNPVSYRSLAQTLGTEWGRQLVSPTLWLDLAAAWMADVQEQTFGTLQWAISDVRFENEADWVRQRGGVIWRIHRPGVAPVRAHASEAGVMAMYAVQEIYNDGNIDDLRLQIGALLGMETTGSLL